MPATRRTCITKNKMNTNKTTYTVPEDSPQMASEPAVAYGGTLQKSCVSNHIDRDRVYVKDGEVKLDLVSDTLSVEKVRSLLHKMVDLEYSLP